MVIQNEGTIIFRHFRRMFRGLGLLVISLRSISTDTVTAATPDMPADQMAGPIMQC